VSVDYSSFDDPACLPLAVVPSFDCESLDVPDRAANVRSATLCSYTSLRHYRVRSAQMVRGPRNVLMFWPTNEFLTQVTLDETACVAIQINRFSIA
jgi:hypothetical protein